MHCLILFFAYGLDFERTLLISFAILRGKVHIASYEITFS